MPKRKQKYIMLKVRDDIDVNINNIDTIVHTDINPNYNDNRKFSDGKLHYVLYFTKNAHYNWVIVPDEYYEKLKEYIK